MRKTSRKKFYDNIFEKKMEINYETYDVQKSKNCILILFFSLLSFLSFSFVCKLFFNYLIP